MKIVKRSGDQDMSLYRPTRSIFNDFFALPSIFDEIMDQTFTSKNLFVDLWEENESFFVKMAVPGVNKEDINITTSDDSITIKASTKKEEKSESESKKYYCKTMESTFEQTINLPAKVNADEAEATYENGVLTVKLPKMEDAKPKKINLK